MKTKPTHRWIVAIAAGLFVGFVVGLLLMQSALAAEDYSEAEHEVFMANQLASIKPPATLRYTYRKSGSMEAGFEDKVTVDLKAQPDGKCCVANAEFLSGERRQKVPEIEGAQGNPVILYFLERDIHEMQRLTKGQHNYFRKRIRMSVYQGAKVNPVSVVFRGKEVSAKEITISPYLDDPLRERFQKLANKQYVFTMSEAVPGGVYAIRTRIAGESASAEPLIVEEMLVEGAAAPAQKP